MWGGTGDLYGNTVAGIWRTPHFVMLPAETVSARPRAPIHPTPTRSKVRIDPAKNTQCGIASAIRARIKSAMRVGRVNKTG
jgi:hypothetical protein